MLAARSLWSRLARGRPLGLMATAANRSLLPPLVTSKHFVGRKSFATGATSAVPEPAKDQETPLTETVRDFLPPDSFLQVLTSRGIDFFTGVPDSLLKDFCAYVSDHVPADRHVITANEGSAVALGTGYHLATRKFPLVYMQNSGFGNAVNPLLSLVDPKVYSVPMLLMIGWRGEPGKKDEPQHMVQGKVMTSLLAGMNISFEVLPDFIEGAEQAIDSAVNHMKTRSAPYALLVRRQTFTQYKMTKKVENPYSMTREQAIGRVVQALGRWDIVVATTGFASRELYELRAATKQGHHRDFLTVGSMGHCSAIACGIAVGKPSRDVYCLDGDGAFLMHMGNVATVASQRLANFKHIVLNNGTHDSVGGQPTYSFQMDLPGIAKAAGYRTVLTASSEAELDQGMAQLKGAEGPALLEVRIKSGARKNLGRPTSTPIENKVEFMKFLEG